LLQFEHGFPSPGDFAFQIGIDERQLAGAWQCQGLLEYRPPEFDSSAPNSDDF
jgi:hypothetical protein